MFFISRGGQSHSKSFSRDNPTQSVIIIVHYYYINIQGCKRKVFVVGVETQGRAAVVGKQYAQSLRPSFPWMIPSFPMTILSSPNHTLPRPESNPKKETHQAKSSPRLFCLFCHPFREITCHPAKKVAELYPKQEIELSQIFLLIFSTLLLY